MGHSGGKETKRLRTINKKPKKTHLKPNQIYFNIPFGQLTATVMRNY